MNERSSLDIPGAEIYVGVVAGFYQSGWHSFASTRRPGVGREQVLIRVTVTRFLESVPIHNASPALSLSLSLSRSLTRGNISPRRKTPRILSLWRGELAPKLFAPLSRPAAVLRFVRETARIMAPGLSPVDDSREFHRGSKLLALSRGSFFVSVSVSTRNQLHGNWAVIKLIGGHLCDQSPSVIAAIGIIDQSVILVDFCYL